jgi:DNA-binding NtrC family response regulator
MPLSRASANELGRLLAAVSEPLYVVAADRRLVFVNEACSVWAGIGAAELVGQECEYGVAADATGPAVVAAALCPPPEAFSGTRLRATIVLTGHDDQARHVEFIPLPLGDKDACGVLAIARSSAGGEETPSDEWHSGRQLHAQLQQYRARLASRFHVDRLLGDSPGMRRTRAQVKLAAASTASVLVLAPAGSGELIGRAIHYGDGGGAAGPLVPFACSLLDTELLQATLRGLARSKMAGQRAGTLLLNEVDALAEGAQDELIHWSTAGTFPARVISTSRAPLTELAAHRRFRADLACALSTLTIELPPLAQRMSDLPLVVQWHIEQANLRSAKQIGGCTPEALDRLAEYAWPDDLRELEEAIVEAHAQAGGPLIGPQDLPQRLTLASQASARPTKPDETIKLEEYLASIEHELIVRALRRAKGNKTKAARLLGMTRPRFYRRLVQLGLAEE